MQHMAKALKFAQLISFALWFGCQWYPYPLFLVVNNAFPPPDGHKNPLDVRDGFAPTGNELAQLPHVIMTSNDPWDPHSLDSEPDNLHFFNTEMDDGIKVWVEYSDYNGEVGDKHEWNVTTCLRAVHTAVWLVLTSDVKPPSSIFDCLQPYFGWTTVDHVKPTLENTTQWFCASGRLCMHCHYKTRLPTAHVSHWNEDVATDTFFSDIAVHDDGIPGYGDCTLAQIQS